MHDLKYIQKEIIFLQQLIDRFALHEQVPGIEFDIALKKTQEIYEQLLRLGIAGKFHAAEKKTDDGEAAFERVDPPVPAGGNPVKEPEQTDPETVPPKAVTQLETDEPQAPHRAEPEGKPDSGRAGTPERQSDKQDAVQKKQTILAEKIKTPKSQINESFFKQKPAADVSARFQFSPLQSIASGVGLNDRFLYIKELFHGNAGLYDQTVEQLDRAGSLENAMALIDRNFTWDRENGTVKKFLDLIDRRHKSDRD